MSIETETLHLSNQIFKKTSVCDFNIQGTAIKLNDTECTFPCGGDANQTCGDAGKISIYQNMNKNVGPIPANKATVTGGWSFTGCFTYVSEFTWAPISSDCVLVYQ